MQDFSKLWTDAELYAKYGLMEGEIAFIEAMIKLMERGKMEPENVFTSASHNQSIRQINIELVKRDDKCQHIINKLREIEHFLGQFGFLTFGRDYVVKVINQKIVSFSINGVMTSLELTMGNIVSCCESACIADANTLLRKYRDDLFFYLYISAYNHLSDDSKQAKSMEAQVAKWLRNDLADFQIGQVLKAIALVPDLQNAVSKYHLKESFKGISENLNNYVHSNGYAFYNRNANAYTEDEMRNELRSLEHHARYMTIVFLLLLIICSPLSIMSVDYIDYLDCNETPPADSLYWVAPFVERFVKQNISLIDPNCLEYLRENTEMQI